MQGIDQGGLRVHAEAAVDIDRGLLEEQNEPLYIICKYRVPERICALVVSDIEAIRVFLQ